MIRLSSYSTRVCKIDQIISLIEKSLDYEMEDCNEESCPINSCGKELRISVPENFHSEDFFVFEGLYHRTEENPTSQDSFCHLSHGKWV